MAIRVRYSLGNFAGEQGSKAYREILTYAKAPYAAGSRRSFEEDGFVFRLGRFRGRGGRSHQHAFAIWRQVPIPDHAGFPGHERAVFHGMTHNIHTDVRVARAEAE